MKKFVALLLAVLLVMVNIAALAAETEPSYSSGANVTSTEVFTKKYDTNVAGLLPDETLSFVATPEETNPTDDNIEITSLKIEKTKNAETGEPIDDTSYTYALTVKYPEYTKVGIYYYYVKETSGNAQGATYDSDELGLAVMVTYGEGTTLNITPYTQYPKNAGDDAEKDDIFNNSYEAGKLTVKKEFDPDSNAASKDQYFSINVKFTATNYVKSDITYTGGTDDTANDQTIAHGTNGWTGDKTVTIKIKAGETVTFSDIPSGVTYTVSEDAAHNAEDPNGSNPATGYTTSISNPTGTIDSGTKAAVVTNKKEIKVPTGITLETLPYVMIMAIAAAGAVALFARKREEY